MPKPDVSSSRISKMPVLRDLRGDLEAISGLDGLNPLVYSPRQGAVPRPGVLIWKLEEKQNMGLNF
mgnify:CR=1